VKNTVFVAGASSGSSEGSDGKDIELQSGAAFSEISRQRSLREKRTNGLI